MGRVIRVILCTDSLNTPNTSNIQIMKLSNVTFITPHCGIHSYLRYIFRTFKDGNITNPLNQLPSWKEKSKLACYDSFAYLLNSVSKYYLCLCTRFLYNLVCFLLNSKYFIQNHSVKSEYAHSTPRFDVRHQK